MSFCLAVSAPGVPFVYFGLLTYVVCLTWCVVCHSTHFYVCCLFIDICISMLFVSMHRLVGLVVKASASRAGGPRFESR